ncbi:MAG: aspartate 1-decarboxylase [Candidatus Omnitrophica bacterium]|nr:aspartate 1-decarboxylase [Candidatus Omnitrophota bacterium]
MLRQMLHGKIHRARVTDACVDYPGSIAIDPKLMEAADIIPGEKVLVANLTSGARVETYAFKGRPGSGDICLNGGAAHYGKKGDIVIIMTFVVLNEDEINSHEPRVIVLNEKNEIIR